MSVYRQKGSPTFSYDFIVKGHRFLGSTGCTTRREAEKVEAQRREDARDQIKRQQHAAGSLAIDHVADRYWQVVGQHHAGADTTERDLARVVQYFGKDKQLPDITDADVIGLVAWRRGHRRTVHRKKPVKGTSTQQPLIAPATVNRSTTEVLKKLFTFAKREGARFDREPEWKKHMLREPEERVRELQQAEADAFADETREDFAPLLAFAQISGLRQKEALLRWPEVDFGARRITKTGKGGKLISIPITPSIREIIWPLQGHHAEFVFTYVAQRTSKRAGTIRGKSYPVTVSGLKTYWKRLRAAAGVEGFRFHDYRHDFGTKLLRKTGNLKLVQRALNHRNIKTTLKYAHVLDDEIAAAVEAVAQDRAVAQERVTESRKPSRKTDQKAS